MTLNFGLFRNIPSFEGGNINAYNKQDFMETGKFSGSSLGAVTSGAFTAIYDNDIISGFRFTDSITGDRWLKWKFDKRIKFKNIYVYIEGNDSGKTGQNKIILQGSNNNSDWTDLDDVGIAGGTTRFKNLIATDVKYRYIRLYVEYESGDGGYVELLYIKSVI